MIYDLSPDFLRVNKSDGRSLDGGEVIKVGANHQPVRMCVSCRQKENKNTFIRIINNNGDVAVDLSGKMPGRGAYIHKSEQCLKIALKKKSLNRALRCNVCDEVYTLLEGQINEQQHT